MPRSDARSFPAMMTALVLALMLIPTDGGAQGIGLSLTPTVEETRWGEDLLIPNTVFPGALASAHFGRFVSLDAHYFQSGRQEVTGSATPIEARRWGGDIFVALAPTPIAPFLRLGAGVVEFRPEQEGAEASRHLAASFGGGLRFAVRDRLSGELSVRRLAFRAGPGSGVIEDDGSGDPVRDIGTYTIGAGLRVPLGGTWDNPETDDAVRNLRTLALPVRLFGGSVGFAEELGLENHAVVGALLGVDLGPFVGTNLYAFGSAEEGLGSPELLYGYGLESSFNLVRRGAGATPHLILGGGRVHFTEADRAVADLDGRKKWTATLGAGVDFRVTDRFRGEAAVRNLVLTQPASTDVSSPDQLRSNWLVSAGVRFVVGGGRGSERPSSGATGRSDTPSRTPSDTSGRRASAGDAPAGGERPRTTSDDIEQLELERQRLLGELEVERLRRALDRLMTEDDPSAAERLLAEERGEPGEPAAPRTFELPVLDEGEIRVRFGPERGIDSVTAARAEGAARRDDAEPAEVRDPRVASLLERVARLEGRIDELSDRADRATAPAVPGNLQVDVQAPGTVGGGAATEPAPRGIFRGEGPGFDGAALYAGGRLEPTSQGIIGGEVDIGSALGGALRVRPGFALGFGSDLIWSLGTDVAWPVPFTLRGIRPGLTAGVGILREGGITRVMIPNLGIELGHQLTDRLEGFMAYQTLDLFDDRRLVLGVRLRPDPEQADANVRITVPARAATGAAAAGGEPATRTPEQPDSAAVAEREALREELGALGAEVEALREQLSRAEATASDAERRAEEARAEARAREEAETDTPEEEPEAEPEESAQPDAAQPSGAAILDELSALERLESVQRVRRVARGVAVVLGGNRTFAVGEAALSPVAHSEIGLIAEQLLGWDYPISIEGHTDSTGSPELNLRLSEDRAAAVRAALVAHGLAPSEVTSTGFGLARPVADNATADGRAANRRVEIVLLVDGAR